MPQLAPDVHRGGRAAFVVILRRHKPPPTPQTYREGGTRGNQKGQGQHDDVRMPPQDGRRTGQARPAPTERERRFYVAPRQPAIKVVQKLNQAADRVRGDEDQECHGTRAFHARCRDGDRHQREANHGCALTYREPRIEQISSLARPQRHGAGKVHLHAKVGGDGHHPPERCSKRHDPECIPGQSARREHGDREERCFASNVGERPVRNERGVPVAPERRRPERERMISHVEMSFRCRKPRVMF